MSIVLLLIAVTLLGFAGGILAGRLAWLILAVATLVILVKAATLHDGASDWMIWFVPLWPFAFIGVKVGMGLRP